MKFLLLTLLLPTFLYADETDKNDINPQELTSKNDNYQKIDPLGDRLAKIFAKAVPGIVIVKTQINQQNVFPFLGNNPIEEFFNFQNPFNNNEEDVRSNTPFPFGQRKVSGMGSGFIIKSDNDYIYVVTNNHVISNAKKILIKFFNKKEVEAKLHGTDPRTDLAVVVVPTANFNAEERKSLTTLSFGDSDKIKVGHHVAAIGSPFGLSNTLTSGIISSKERFIPKSEIDLGEWIQHSAAINQGNSGGALFNMYGQIIGINTMIVTPDGGHVGLGLALTANIAKNVIDQLINSKKVERGFLGITVLKIPDNNKKVFGLKDDEEGYQIVQVHPDGPSYQKLIPGDVIVQFNNKNINDNWRGIVSRTKPGTVIKIGVLRSNDSQTKDISITVGKSNNYSSKGTTSIEVEGLLLSETLIKKTKKKGLSLEKIIKRNQTMELKQGDLIIAARYTENNIAAPVRKEINSVNTFQKIIEACKSRGDNSVVLEILRTMQNDEEYILYITFEFIEDNKM